jgi:hypothetical protein
MHQNDILRQGPCPQIVLSLQAVLLECHWTTPPPSCQATSDFDLQLFWGHEVASFVRNGIFGMVHVVDTSTGRPFSDDLYSALCSRKDILYRLYQHEQFLASGPACHCDLRVRLPVLKLLSTVSCAVRVVIIKCTTLARQIQG